MVVANFTGEKQPGNEREHRVPQILVQRRHSPRLNSALKTISHHQIIAFPELLHKRHQMQEIITVVCISHNYIFAKGAVAAAYQGRAVPFFLHFHDSCAVVGRNLPGAVRTPIVGNYNLSIYPALSKKSFGLADTGCQCLRLIEAGHQYCQLKLFLHL